MNYSFNVRILSHFYHSAVKAELERRNFPKDMAKKIFAEHKAIVTRMNRSTGKTAEENYEIFKNGLCASKLFHKAVGNVDSYLDEKKMPGRLAWSEESHKRKYENDWVVDILPANSEYDLGYDYYECGICKLCKDEGCPELAQYLCRMDYVLADIMDMKLTRTKTIAEGADMCDFRYSRK